MSKRNLLANIVILALFAFTGCASTSYLGDWNYTVSELPDGDATGTMTITETEEGLNCHVKDSYGYAEFDMESCEINDGTFTGFYYDDMGTKIDVSGVFGDENTLTGSINIQGPEFPLKVIRVKEE